MSESSERLARSSDRVPGRAGGAVSACASMRITHVRAHTHVCACVHACMCACMHACVHACVRACACVHVCACACVCTRVHACACLQNHCSSPVNGSALQSKVYIFLMLPHQEECSRWHHTHITHTIHARMHARTHARTHAHTITSTHPAQHNAHTQNTQDART